VRRDARCLLAFTIILSYIFVLPTSFLRISKTTALHYRYDMQMCCTFCKPTFSGATHEWDALYYACEIVRKENAQFTFALGMWMIFKKNSNSAVKGDTSYNCAWSPSENFCPFVRQAFLLAVNYPLAVSSCGSGKLTRPLLVQTNWRTRVYIQ
jgi:hypothetical protein